MLFFSYFITEAGVGRAIKVRLHRAFTSLFGIGAGSLEAILTGLTGGFCCACKSAGHLYSQGLVKKEEARRTALFFTNPGLAFTVSITGTSVLSSTRTGIRLYIISVFTSIIYAIIYNSFNKNRDTTYYESKDRKVAEIFTVAVSHSSQAILSICFNIIIFTALREIISAVLPFQFIKSILLLTGEVSSAILYSGNNFPVYITFSSLVFGGLCIFLQNLNDLNKLSIKPLNYLLIRAVFALICAAIEFIYEAVFPHSVAVSAGYKAEIYSSPVGTVSLILLCAVYLISVKKLKSSPVCDNIS